MNEILIRNENQPELRFNGQLIAETKFGVDFCDDATREFNLRVYAIENGGFVSMLQYDTTSDSEKPLVWYEDMDCFKDVENFFFVFEANEVIRDYDRLNRGNREQSASSCRRIAKAFETSLFQFLDHVRSRASQLKFGDRIAERESKPSILRALGLKR